MDQHQIKAYHEAGHAVIARALDQQVVSVALSDGVRTRYRRDAVGQRYTAIVALAGPVAEDRRRPTTDAQRAVLWQAEWAADWAKVLLAGDVGTTYDAAAALVARHWDAIERVGRRWRRRES
jgi:hypothetical protein